jgi:hypothetical protein
VQQKLMRHADIRTTMNLYGDVVTDEMREWDSQYSNNAFACNILTILNSTLTTFLTTILASIPVASAT